MEGLGYQTTRSTAPAAETLDAVDAPHTTYILAGPNAPGEEAEKREHASIERFLRRGGRVLATGFDGADFLPGGRTGSATQFVGELCTTVPEGSGELAQAGPVAAYDAAPWTSPEPLVRVDQRCGADAVVVHRPYPHGGMMVWFASAEPISNRGLTHDNSLHLLLLAVGPSSGEGARRVIFRRVLSRGCGDRSRLSEGPAAAVA